MIHVLFFTFYKIFCLVFLRKHIKAKTCYGNRIGLFIYIWLYVQHCFLTELSGAGQDGPPEDGDIHVGEA